MGTRSGPSRRLALRPLASTVSLAALAVVLLTALAAPTAEEPPYDPPAAGRVAQSPPPHLRFPDAVPETPPRFDPAAPSAGPGARAMVSCDLRTREITRRPASSPEDVLGPRWTEALAGLLETSDGTDPAAKNFTDWTVVPDPTVGAYPRRVKLWVRYYDTDGIQRDRVSSGTLIDPLHVLTAAHCIYKHDNDDPPFVVNDYAALVEAAPAYHDGVYPFGSVQAIQLHAWEGWTQDEDAEYDVALIDLAWPIGALTGTYGFGHHPDYDWFLEGVWEHAAYPAESPFTGNQLAEATGTYDNTFPLFNWIGWNNESYGGTSGGGAVRDGLVWAVRSRGSDVPVQSYDCMVDDFMFDDILGWIAEDTPAGPDLMPLWVRGDTTAYSDEDLNPLTFALVNYSSAPWSGSVSYDVHLSINDVVTADDRLVASGGFVVDLDPRGYVTVLMPTVHVPPDMAGGQYWLGVVVENDDANPGNNGTSGVQAMALEVLCRDSDPPIRNIPYSGTNCLDASAVTLDWSDEPGAVEYEVRLVNNSDPVPDQFLRTTLSQITVEDLAWYSSYNWAVRQRSGCLVDWGAWSDSWWHFITAPDPDEAPTALYPHHAARCVPPDTVLFWSDRPYDVSYEVQVGSECGEGGVHATTSPEWPVSLRGGRTYYWRVRTWTNCDEWNAWSPCRRFVTTPDSVAVPRPMLPEAGVACAPSDAVFLWEDDPEAEGWELQLGTACGEGEVIQVGENTLTVPRLQGGVDYWWRVRMLHECGLISDWSPCVTFQVDVVPPIGAYDLHGVSHDPGVWSSLRDVGVAWEHGADDCTPVMYSYLWDAWAGTTPDGDPETGNPYATSPALDDGDHWFHLRTLDPAGNHADPDLHLGPFHVDGTPPGAAEILYATVDPDSPGGHPNVWCAWVAAEDEPSGVAGYSWCVDPSELAVPDAEPETDETWDRARLEAEGPSYFHVHAVDRAGNAGSKRHIGPFLVDQDLVGAVVTRPHVRDILTEGEVFPVTWDLEVPAGRTVGGGSLAFSEDAGQSWRAVAPLSAAEVLAGSWSWTPPASATALGAIRLEIVDDQGARVATKSELFTLARITAADPPTVPERFALLGNVPNPFNPQTVVAFEVPRPCDVALNVYDMRGHLVRTLMRGSVDQAGRYEASWNGTDVRGRRVSGGVYFCRLEAEGYRETRRMTLVK